LKLLSLNKQSYKLFVLLFSVLFFGQVNLFAQTNIAELESKLKDLSGKERIKGLITLSEYYQKNSIQKAIDFANLSVTEASKDIFSKEYAEALVNRGFCYYLTNTIDSAKAYYMKSLEISESLKDSNLTVNALTNLGLIFWRLGNYNEAFKHYFSAQNILQKLHDEQLLAKTYNYIGLIYWKRGEYADALEYFIKSLGIKENYNDKSEIAITLNNIARIYFELGDSKEALRYSQRANNISEKIQDKYVLGRSYNNLGNAYYLIGNLKEAADYQYKSIEIKHEASDLTGLGYSYNDLGSIYLKQGLSKDAVANYKKALEIRSQLADYFGISETLLNLSEVYKVNNKKDSAYLLLNQSIKISEKQNLRELMRRGYLQLSNYYQAEGISGEALKYFKKYSEIKDSILSQKNREKISELQIIYESENKQKEIDLLKKERELQEFALETQERSNWVLLGALAILISSLIFLYYRLSVERNLKKSVQEKNNEISYTASKLEEANSTKDKFFSIIAHDLRSPFLGLRGLIDFINNDYDNIPDELKKEQLQLIGKNVHNIFTLIQNLLTWAQIQKGTIPFHPDIINLHKIADTSISLHEYVASNKQIKIVNNIPSEINVYADENMVNSILNNLISNGIKFTNKGGVVTLSAKSEGDLAYISVADNGVGMTEDEMKKIFDISAKHSTYGTEEEKGTGLGLTICQEMVELNGGFIKVESTLEKGTTFTFSLSTKI